MFKEKELRIIREQFQSIKYIRTLTTDELAVLHKVDGLIVEKHFKKNKNVLEGHQDY